jgi:hypothetical protein
LWRTLQRSGQRAQTCGPRISLAVRTRGDAARQTQALSREIQSIDPDLTLAKIETLEEAMALSVSEARFDTALLALFAGIALGGPALAGDRCAHGARSGAAGRPARVRGASTNPWIALTRWGAAKGSPRGGAGAFRRRSFITARALAPEKTCSGEM